MKKIEREGKKILNNFVFILSNWLPNPSMVVADSIFDNDKNYWRMIIMFISNIDNYVYKDIILV